MFERPDRIKDTLYVVTTVFNPERFRSRWRLYQDFALHVAAAGAKLVTVEIAFGEREFAVTEANNPFHVQLRTLDEIWLKENALNIAVSRLPSDAKYIAWADADIQFARGDWADETLHKLQHYHVVQMFSEALDMSPDYTQLLRHQGFCYSYRHRPHHEAKLQRNQLHCGTAGPAPDEKNSGIITWHPGFAWATTREAFDTFGGLIDFALAGAADNHMAKGLIGEAESSMHPGVTPGYRKMVMEWQERALLLKKDIGYVKGLLLHHYHGPKKNRRYWERWKILVDNGYDPSTDIQRDRQGLFKLIDHGDDRIIRLRQGLREYFGQRNEDALPCEE